MATPKTIRELLVKLGVKADTKQLAAFNQGLAAVKKGMGTAVLAAGALTAAAGGVTYALYHTVKAAAEVGDEAAKTAKIVGLSTEAWTEFQHAAARANVESRVLRISFANQARTAQDAMEGSKTLADAYSKLGLSGSKLKNLSKDQASLFEEVSDGLRKLDSDSERLSIAQKIFGIGGSRLMPLLREGSVEIKRLRQQARDLGLVIDGDTGTAAENFNDALADAKDAIGALKTQFGLALMPVFTEALTAFREWFIVNRKWIKQRIDQVVENIKTSFDRLKKAAIAVNNVVQHFGGWAAVLQPLAAIAAALGTAFAVFKIGGPIVSGIMFLVDALLVLGGGSLLAGLGWLAVIIAGLAVQLTALIAYFSALYLVLEDVAFWLMGGRSALGGLIEKFKGSNSIIGSFSRYLDQARENLWMVLEAMKPIANMLSIVLPWAFEQFKIGAVAAFKIVEPYIWQIADILEKKLWPLRMIFDILGEGAKFLGDILEDLVPMLDKAFGSAKNIEDVKAGFSFLGNQLFGLDGGQPDLAPRQVAAAGGNSTTNNSTVEAPTTINVNGAGDPEEVARKIAEEQRRQLRHSLETARSGNR